MTSRPRGLSHEEVVEIMKNLANRIGNLALVYKGWPNQKHVKDLRRTRGLPGDLEMFASPEVSLTEIDYLPDRLMVNVWAQSRRERDEVSQMVIDTLVQIKKEHKVGIKEIWAYDITLEEKGQVRPGKWDIIKGSKPLFRKAIDVRSKQSFGGLTVKVKVKSGDNRLGVPVRVDPID